MNMLNNRKTNPYVAVVAAVAVCLLLVQSGCSGGSDDPRGIGLSGRVTFDGQPVPFGRIVFTPDKQAGNSGPQGFAEIRNGTYDTASGKGTVGGPHVVRITGFGANPAAGDEDNPVPALFPDFETKHDVPRSTSTHDFDVPAD